MLEFARLIVRLGSTPPVTHEHLPASYRLRIGVRVGSLGVISPESPLVRGGDGEPGDQRVYVQPAEPDFGGLTGLWVQTGLGDGSGMTIWIEDGQI